MILILIFSRDEIAMFWFGWLVGWQAGWLAGWLVGSPYARKGTEFTTHSRKMLTLCYLFCFPSGILYPLPFSGKFFMFLSVSQIGMLCHHSNILTQKTHCMARGLALRLKPQTFIMSLCWASKTCPLTPRSTYETN